MAGPDPAVAALRTAVRPWLTAGTGPVLVACSGGADSVALAAALAFEAPRAGRPVGAVTVDHGLQPGSAEQAEVMQLRRALARAEQELEILKKAEAYFASAPTRSRSGALP